MQTILIIGFLILVAYGLYSMLTGQSPKQQMKRELNRMLASRKPRPPIIYLRAFASDALGLSDVKNAFVGKTVAGTMAYWKDAGHMVTDFLRVIAPTKELSSPDNAWRLKPWAPTRPESVAVANENWQREILDWLPNAPLVVIQLDDSIGLVWEVRHVIRLVAPTKVILVLPPSQSEYDEMRNHLNNLFPKGLPVQLPPSRLATFNSAWQPIPLPEPSSGGPGMWQTFEIVFNQNGFESPPWRRIYGFKSVP